MMTNPALAFLPTMIDLRITQFCKNKVKQILAHASRDSHANQLQRKERLISLKESRVQEELALARHWIITFPRRRGERCHTRIACKSSAWSSRTNMEMHRWCVTKSMLLNKTTWLKVVLFVWTNSISTKCHTTIRTFKTSQLKDQHTSQMLTNPTTNKMANPIKTTRP